MPLKQAASLKKELGLNNISYVVFTSGHDSFGQKK